MKANSQNTNTTTILLVLIALVIGLTVYTVPIDSTMDVYIDYSINKPGIFEPIKITSISAVAHGHTLMTSPLSGGSVFGIDLGIAEDVIQSGTIKIVATAGDIQAEKTIGNIIITTTASGTIVVPKVPKSQKEILISTYDEGKLIETQKVILK